MSVSSTRFELADGSPGAGEAERAAERTEALRHMPQLDAVRAFAILGVMACHFFDNPITDVGGRGVNLFFVLSGFLITGILLKCKTYVERDGQSRLFTLRQFYARRFLRIFPLYYMVLAVLWLIHDPGVRAHPVWHLAYLTNIRRCIDAAHQYYPNWSIGHFWSLAVEEQFYLVWPWVVLFMPRRSLPWVVLAMICSTPAFRFVALTLKFQVNTILHLPTFWLDALGLGALLAIVTDPGFGLRDWLAHGRRVALAAGVVLVAASTALLYHHRMYTVSITVNSLGYALVFAWLVGRAAEGFEGMTGRVMTSKPLLWIGAISYGIYVYHYILRTYAMTLEGLPTLPSPLLRAAVLGSLSILLAAVSFYVYERPLNQLRRFFDYRAKAPVR